MNNLLSRAALAAALFASPQGLVLAQTMPTPAAAQPAQTLPRAAQRSDSAASGSAAVPASNASAGPGYQSAFEGYRRFIDEPVAAWKAVNDNVGRIGGWRVYAREAAGSQAGNAVTDAPAAAPSSPGLRPTPPGSASAPAPRQAPAPAGAASSVHKNHN